MSRHAIAMLLTSLALLWGAGFAHAEDGGPTPPLSEVVAAIASAAESGPATERLHGPTVHRTS